MPIDRLRRPYYGTLDDSFQIYFLASGGRDSTAMILEAHRLGFEGKMVWNNTKFNLSSKPVLERISEITGYELIEVKYSGKKKPIKVLKESFHKIPNALKKLDEGSKRWRNQFLCCHLFKERPMSRFLKDIDKNESVLILGIKGTDGSFVRRWRLSELRKKHTYFRRQTNGFLYYYPLRDCRNKDIDEVLSEFKMGDIRGSGCAMCPVFCLFETMKDKDPITYARSTTYAKRLGIEFPGSNQTKLDQFCSGIEEE